MGAATSQDFLLLIDCTSSFCNSASWILQDLQRFSLSSFALKQLVDWRADVRECYHVERPVVGGIKIRTVEGSALCCAVRI